jgi:dolichol-phosphate mannosyltransferase
MTLEKTPPQPTQSQQSIADTPLQRAVVVLPTYDELENIVDIAGAILAQQAQIADFELHVLVSDSNSQDGTIAAVEALMQEDPRVHFLNVQQRGIGRALYHGFQHAIEQLDADVLVEMDADFQHNPHDLTLLLKGISEGYDVVVGSRFLTESHNHMPFYRKVLSVGANQVLRLALGLKDVTEITTSFRAFRKEAFMRLPQDAVPWYEERSFIAVPVFLVRMLEAGASATEVPMTMHPRVRGYSKMIYWRYIRDVLWFSFRDRLGMTAG